ncbi:MAG: tRNA 2-thiouridine(34) synthase MnmA, partial [Mycoplasma sp.]|nr:tRNA 2-thiouridine(34) synthase MnmA [Mycoplasma sp.]
MAKIIIAMSGGVDSSVAAYLLKKQNHDVIGVFMRNWDSLLNNDILGNPEIDQDKCNAEKDYEDAKHIANLLNIELHRIDFVKEYYELVFKDFLNDFKLGLTPNPDIWCNKYIKFDLLIKLIEKKFPDYNFLATGHYARVENNLLLTAFDDSKDQTYFLAQINKNILSKVIFPIGQLKKTKVREIAQAQNFINAKKKDSVGICFVGERKFAKFLSNYIENKPGDIINIRTNEKIGNHNGCFYYTLGQRRGFGLNGLNKPFYIVKKDLQKNIIYVDDDKNSEYLMSNVAILNNINWLVDDYKNYKNIQVRFRYQANLVNVKEIIEQNSFFLKIIYDKQSLV